MHILTEKLRAPEFRLAADAWIQGGPLSMAALRGKVALIDFWDYTCVNCIHTLPYLREWHARYADAGLVIVGLHAPEFAFAKDAALVQSAVRRFELPYPVALDSGFRMWDAYANRAWPAKYLLDAQGYIRAVHHGEGEYEAFERMIQEVLHEIHPGQPFPEPMAPLRVLDAPGAVCERPTPELYLGYGRGEIGNREGNPPNQAVHYRPPEAMLPGVVYLEGPWLNGKEYVESVVNEPAAVHLEYRAAQVNLVMGSVGEKPVNVTVLLDGAPVPPESRGEDMAPSAPDSVIEVSAPRMHALVSYPDFQSRRLTLRVGKAGLRAYAFTFVSCVS